MLPRSPDKYFRFGGPGRGVSFFQTAGFGAASSSKAAPDRLLSSHEALHQSPVTAAACSEDGLLLLTGASDGTCRLWNVAALQSRSGPGQVRVEVLSIPTCSRRGTVPGRGSPGQPRRSAVAHANGHLAPVAPVAPAEFFFLCSR